MDEGLPHPRDAAGPGMALWCTYWGLWCVLFRAVLNGKKKVFQNQFSQKSPRALHVLNHGWWRLAVGGWWRLAVGDWWLVAVGSGWQLAVGRRWQLAAVGGWRLVAVGGWRLVAVGGWRLMGVGGWRLVVPRGGP